MNFAKSRPVRSESYRRFVASHPCLSCGIEGWSQCAHANGGGMGTKACDLETFPLCATRPGHMGCHLAFDLCLDMSKQQRRELTAVYVATMQSIARAAGRPEFREAA